jgi:hypothetical protein
VPVFMECMAEKAVEAVGYMRTSSATNVGADKDSEKRQRAAIEGYANGSMIPLSQARTPSRVAPALPGCSIGSRVTAFASC